ncbi:MAG: O-antigen ligase family protein [candidate division WOR-3 bacterium]|nr:MAG: O-antigen ligase family protein [candidate division WOR-3 bacterium]
MSALLKLWGLGSFVPTYSYIKWLLISFICLQGALIAFYILYPASFVPFVISALLLTIFLTLMFHNPLYGLLFIVVTMIVTNHYFPFAAVLVFRERMLLMVILLLFLVTSGAAGSSILKGGDFSRPLLIFLAILFTSAIYGLARGNSQFIVAQEFEMYVYLLAYFMIVSLVNTPEDAKLVVSTIIIATVTMAFIAVVIFFYMLQFKQIFFYKGSLGHVVYVKNAMIPRVISNAEMFLPVTVNLIVSLLLFVRSTRATRYLLTSALIVLLFAVFISLTRGMWLSTLISTTILIGYYLYLRGRRAFLNLARVSFIAVIILIILAYTLASQPIWQRIVDLGAIRATSIFQGTLDISLFNRYQEILQVMKSVRSHPLFGIGLGAIISWRDMLFPWITHAVFYIHNSYFWMLLKMGIIGISAFTVILYFVFRKAITLLRTLESSYQRAIIAGLSTGLVSVLIFSITSPFINLGAGNFYIALTIGLITVVEKLNR